MIRGDRVRVKKLAQFDQEFRGQTGTVDDDNEPGEVVLVRMDKPQPGREVEQFVEDDLEPIK